MNYASIKKWCVENKQSFLLGACFILVFLIGFGTGRYERETRKSPQTQKNYTTNSEKKQNTTDTQNKEAGEQGIANNIKEAAAEKLSGECIVKGNISSAGKKIYHIKGGAFYNTVKPEQCFKTESEAAASGFVKSQR